VAEIHIIAGRAPAGYQAACSAVDLFKETGDDQAVAYSLLLGSEGLFLSGDGGGANRDASLALQKFQELKDTEGEAKAKAVLDRFARESPGGRGRGGPAIADAGDAGDGGAAAGVANSMAVAKGEGMTRAQAEQLAKQCAIDSVGDEEGIDMDSPLMDLGLDSLASISFREQLVASSGLKLPTSLVFDYPSLTAIAEFMVEASSE